MIKPYSFPLTPDQSETVGPLLYVGMLLGPSVSGLLLTGLMNGKDGYRQLYGRLTSWRSNILWYTAATFGTPILATILLLGLSLFSPEFTPQIFSTDEKSGLIMIGAVVGLMVGFFEELGWTGFAVPQLRQRYSIHSTGLIVGLLWGLWHFPPFWGTNSFSGGLPLSILLGQLFAWLPPFRTIMVHVYDRTKSLLVTVLMHASLVFTTLTLPSLELSGVYLLTWLAIWGATLWGIVAVTSRIMNKQIQTAKSIQRYMKNKVCIQSFSNLE
jgi:membrane protease YdiL (CAAX protease family)